MNEGSPRYLRVPVVTAFTMIEGSIQDGYSLRAQLFREHDTLRNQGQPVTQEHRDKWHAPYAEWVNSVRGRLLVLFFSPNYADEFFLAPRMKPSYGRQNEDGIFTSIVDNQLYMIQKLEEFRDRIWQKSSIVINNSGQLTLQVGDNNSNEQSA